jgi:hypothetical protein
MWTITFWGRTTNPTLDYLPLGLWSIIELDVGIICACMPGMAGLLRRILPRAFATLKGSSNSNANTNDLRTYRGEGRMGSSSNKHKISKTTDVHVSFGSRSERNSKDDNYELLGGMPSQTPLRLHNVEELNHVDKNEYPCGETREYGKKW